MIPLSDPTAALPRQQPLARGWLGYALIHCLTVSMPCKELKRSWPRLFAAYRLLYSALALLLLNPLSALSTQSPGLQR